MNPASVRVTGWGMYAPERVVTNADLDELGCLAVAQGAHDGLARAVHPPHLSVDGDAVVAAATGQVRATPDQARTLAVLAFAAAVRQAVA